MHAADEWEATQMRVGEAKRREGMRRKEGERDAV
jgi:hypothetical protein